MSSGYPRSFAPQSSFNRQSAITHSLYHFFSKKATPYIKFSLSLCELSVSFAAIAAKKIFPYAKNAAKPFFLTKKAIYGIMNTFDNLGQKAAYPARRNLEARSGIGI